MKNKGIRKNITVCFFFLLISALLMGKIEIVKAEELPTLSGSNMDELEDLKESSNDEFLEDKTLERASTDGWLRWLGKNVVKYAEEVEGISGIPEGITYPGEEAAVFPRDKKITILYKIDVEGTEGKSYTLIEEGAFWVAGGVAHQVVDGKLYVAGVVPESKKDFVYVARTFYNTDIIGGRLKSSVLIVPGCNGMKNTTAVRTLPVVDPPITDAGAVDEDLTFQKTALLDGTEVDKVVIGTVYQYRVTITNHLSVPVKELEVYERLNQNYVSFLDAEPTGQYDVQRGVWTIETLGAKETATLTLTVRADRTTTLNQPYKNTINAWADNYEVPMGAEDKAQAEVRIVAAESMYTVYYHYNDKTEETEEKIEVVTGTGKVGDKIPYDTEKREYEGESYEFVSVSEKGKVIEENSEENVLHVYYVREEIEEPEEPEPEPEPEEPEPEEPEPEEPEPEEPEPEEPEPEEPEPEEPEPEEPEPEEPEPEEPEPEEPKPEEPEPEEPEPEEPEPEEPEPEPEEPEPEEPEPDKPKVPEKSEIPNPSKPPRTPCRPKCPSEPSLPESPIIPNIPIIVTPPPIIHSETDRIKPSIPCPCLPKEIIESKANTTTENIIEQPITIPEEIKTKVLIKIKGRHLCCILHFCILLVALIIEWFYMRNIKKHQRKIFEIRMQLLELELEKNKEEKVC